jgi:Ser/Thr protein kinase RdoA (MazF antagonist)
MSDAVVDPVLTEQPPSFTSEEAEAFARELFGVVGTATATNSERDQAFLIDGDEAAVLKISNAAESTDQLDMEALAVQHIALVDPEIPVALPKPVPGEPGSFRASIERGGQTHWVRLYDRLPGRAWVDGPSLSDDAIRDWGTMAARVGRALRGFWHASAKRTMLWDPQHTLALRPLLGSVRDPEAQALVERALDRYEQVVTPVWPSLRAQVVHTDLDSANVLVDDAGRVTGIIDFGDASWSALVVDPAAAMVTMVEGRDGDPNEFFRAARLMIDGYERITPLEAEERRILGELLAARMCAGIVVPASRAALYEDSAHVPQGARGLAFRILSLLESTGWMRSLACSVLANRGRAGRYQPLSSVDSAL